MYESVLQEAIRRHGAQGLLWFLLLGTGVDMLEDVMTPYSRSHSCFVGCGELIRWAVWRDEKGRRCQRIIECCDCPVSAKIVPLTEAELKVGQQIAERIARRFIEETVWVG